MQSPWLFALAAFTVVACASHDGAQGPMTGSTEVGGQTPEAGTEEEGGTAGAAGDDSGAAGPEGGANGAEGGSADGGEARAEAGGSAGTADASAGSGDGGIGAGNKGDGAAEAGAISNPWITYDVANVVARSNIVLKSANTTPIQFMPVGNGSFAAAVWAASGFTAQLNRGDAFPDRKSPGWLTIPGLAPMTTASDFHATLDLYNAVLTESGGGMTATIYVRADSDELIVDVTGADPASTQTASVALWSGRSPKAQATGAIATLSESWTDNSELGNSGQPFGTLAALTAGGRRVSASVASSTSVSVSFQPNADGSFRVICASPSFNGGNSASSIAGALLGNDASAPSSSLQAGHLAWWHDYWRRVGLVEMTSSDGSAEYVENLRAIYLYVTACEMRGELPGSQAGIADLFNFTQDSQDWDPAAYWFWNLRMEVAANMSSGAFDMNASVFHLYASNVSNLQTWTLARMGNRAGICVPETMRFNGNGWYKSNGNQSCDETITATWNSLTITTGAEVALWIWQQYLMTGDAAFLQTNYPVMSQAATFLLAYATKGSDGLLHTQANAHESQWNVTDPTTDIAAMRALFPVVIQAAQTLGTDASLVTQLQAAIPALPPFPRTNTQRTQVLTSSSDSSGDIFAFSTQPTAMIHNSENIDLEPVFPYGLVTDASGVEFTIAQRTYTARRNKDSHDWSNDSIHAARLGLASEVPARISAIIASNQAYPCGLAAFNTTPTSMKEPYIEADGVLATAINEALAQDFDGTLRIAPAWPTAWGLTGTAYIQGRSKVDVHFANGALAFAVVEAGTTGTTTVRNPWSNAQATVIDSTGQQVVAPTSGSTLSVKMQQGLAYLIKKSSDPVPTPVVVTGTPATAVKTYGPRTIGVP